MLFKNNAFHNYLSIDTYLSLNNKIWHVLAMQHLVLQFFIQECLLLWQESFTTSLIVIEKKVLRQVIAIWFKYTFFFPNYYIFLFSLPWLVIQSVVTFSFIICRTTLAPLFFIYLMNEQWYPFLVSGFIYSFLFQITLRQVGYRWWLDWLFNYIYILSVTLNQILRYKQILNFELELHYCNGNKNRITML